MVYNSPYSTSLVLLLLALAVGFGVRALGAVRLGCGFDHRCGGEGGGRGGTVVGVVLRIPWVVHRRGVVRYKYAGSRWHVNVKVGVSERKLPGRESIA